MCSRLIAFSFILFAFGVASIFGQNPKPPYWVIDEQGNSLFAKKEFGAALQKYQQAITSAGIYPEAEMAIGDIYREEGETGLAIRQYQKAYNLRKYFYITDMQYEVLYKLALIFQEQQLYGPMEDALLGVVQDDRNFHEPTTSHLREQIELNYYEKGLDYVLKMYRFQSIFAEEAHSQLGWFYYKTGRFEQSKEHLMYAIILKVSETTQYSLEKDNDFQFTTLSDYLTTTESDSVIGRYFQASNIYRDLYYLAGSTYEQGYPLQAASIWKLLSELKSSGQYADLSKRQLKSPWREPFIQLNDKPKKTNL